MSWNFKFWLNPIDHFVKKLLMFFVPSPKSIAYLKIFSFVFFRVLWIIDPKVKARTIKLSEENIVENE